MPSLNPYLNFNGNCEEAFNHYKAVFGGDFLMMSRFSEMPPGAMGTEELPEEAANLVMHVTLPISESCVLMGSDCFPGQPATSGNNFSISISCDSKEEVDRIFAELSQGGGVIMPLDDTFWGSYFGMLSDKFGIQWMVSCDINKGDA